MIDKIQNLAAFEKNALKKMWKKINLQFFSPKNRDLKWLQEKIELLVVF